MLTAWVIIGKCLFRQCLLGAHSSPLQASCFSLGVKLTHAISVFGSNMVRCGATSKSPDAIRAVDLRYLLTVDDMKRRDPVTCPRTHACTNLPSPLATQVDVCELCDGRGASTRYPLSADNTGPGRVTRNTFCRSTSVSDAHELAESIVAVDQTRVVSLDVRYFQNYVAPGKSSAQFYIHAPISEIRISSKMAH